jgi:hypothetical protein
MVIMEGMMQGVVPISTNVGGISITSSATTYATVLATGPGQVFSINEGTFFYEGFFVTNPAQIIATSK